MSGAEALVWQGGARVPYMPGANPARRAYCWSALRNSANNLKCVFAWSRGPFVRRTVSIFGFSHTFKAGWQLENGVRVPVLS